MKATILSSVVTVNLSAGAVVGVQYLPENFLIDAENNLKSALNSLTSEGTQ